MRRLAVPILCLLAACVPTTDNEVAGRNSAVATSLPPMKTFSSQRAGGVSRPNLQIAQDFLDLTFQMESGRPLPWLTRFEGPIKVAVAGQAPASLEGDLARLLGRLRSEAGIDISRAKRGEDAQITVEAIPRKTLQKAVPQAACFVVPNVTGWSQFKRNRGNGTTDWTRLSNRTKATVIIPSDVSPQEVRDCLHEEISQALGPLNDLYRLPDSIFNDDNFHTILTGFDMLILRAYYSPELRNGMTRGQVARVLPGVLSRLNPRGNRATNAGANRTPKQWNDAITSALALRTSQSQRAAQAAKAVKIAQAQGWKDNRLAFSLFVQGRVSLATKPETAISAFVQSGNIYKQLYGASVHAAHVNTQMAAFALSSGQLDVAIRLTDEGIPAARNSSNAALLATLLMIKAEALQAAGRDEEAHSVRLDSLGWGRYGFGSERNVRARLNEIKALAPRRVRS
ncbi:DUF2927 domain-containing protein [Litoreibacter janthinus]|uniref:ATP-dependent transcriptional regulator n=1 Tax=Litoreibacter janthinus TaxID=670154 RepID=A0A1I6GPM8_9RHOB|nr:DUF2927 domain-containing protein [Litoreibacter janthinus]SFR44183.1 Protein of unknown function [Litoreibacter janthinus]